MPQPRESFAKAVMLIIFAVALCFVYYQYFAGHQALMDFRDYYSAAQMVRHGRGDELYVPEKFQAFQMSQFGGTGHFFIAPPLAACLYVPSASFNPQHGYALWSAISFVLLFASILIVTKAVPLKDDPMEIAKYATLFLPLHLTLLQGQIDTVVVLGLAACYYGFSRGKDFASGLALTVALVKYPVVVPFVIVMALWKRWRFLFGFLAGSIAFSVGCFAIGGVGFIRAYIDLVRSLGNNAVTGINPMAMPNFRGQLFAITQHESPTAALIFAAMILLLVAKFWQADSAGFAAGLTASTITSYYLNPHSLILLLIPLLIWWPRIRSTGPLMQASYAAVALPIVPALILWTGRFAWMSVFVGAFLLGQFLVPLSQESRAADALIV